MVRCHQQQVFQLVDTKAAALPEACRMLWSRELLQAETQTRSFRTKVQPKAAASRAWSLNQSPQQVASA